MNNEPNKIIDIIADHFALVDDEFANTDDKELKLIYSITRSRIYDILLEACDYDHGLAECYIEDAIDKLARIGKRADESKEVLA